MGRHESAAWLNAILASGWAMHPSPHPSPCPNPHPHPNPTPNPTLPLRLTRWAATLGPLLEQSLRDEIRASLAELPLPRSLHSVHLVCCPNPNHAGLKPKDEPTPRHLLLTRLSDV